MSFFWIKPTGFKAGQRSDVSVARIPSAQLLTAAMAILLLAGGFAVPAFASDQEDLSARHEAAVMAARDGRLEQSLEQLATLRSEYPNERRVLVDQTIVLSWAGHDAEVVDNARLLDPALDSFDVVPVVAKAYRNLEQYAEAVAWYEAALDRQPDDVDARLGLVMSLADAGQFARAESELGGFSQDAARSVPVLRVKAYLMRAQGRLLEVLSSYDAMLASHPGDRDVLRDKALLLRQLLMPEHSLRLAKEYPGILSEDEVAGLEADELALSIRNSGQIFEPRNKDVVDSKDALARVNAYLATLPEGSPHAVTLRQDRLLALVDANQFKDAVTEYEWLRSQGEPLPVYVLFAAAKAYSVEGRPADARELLTVCRDAEPENFDYRVEEYYVLLELGELDLALERAQEMLERQVPIRTDRYYPRPNPDYLLAKLRIVLAKAYADRLDEAQADLELLAREAPHNASIRQELAAIYMWRGWPERAIEQYQQILTIYPEHEGARVGLAGAQYEKQQYQLVEQEVSELLADYPDDRQVQELSKRWQLHTKGRLIVESSFGNSSGDTFGSSHYTVNSWWFSAPIDDWYRAYVHTFDTFAEFQEGDGRRRRIAAGLDFRRGDWTARGEVSTPRWGGDAGLHTEVDRRLSDKWSVGSSLEFNSYDMLLRGYINDVQNDQLSVRTSFNPSEMTSAGASVTTAKFDDSNNRHSLSLFGNHRLLNEPKWKVDATAFAYTSRNSLDGASYFNPKQDKSLAVGALIHWYQLQQTNRRIYHRLHPQVGTYNQDGFGGNSVWRLDYELELQLNRRWLVRLGAGRGRHAYDGGVEYSTTFLLGLEGIL
jgi:biofilm PGA synthesis protein PgaA